MKRILIKIFLLFTVHLFLSCSGGGGETTPVSYDYHTPEEIEVFLDEIKLNYPSITSLETVGYSTDGRVIRAIVISDNPATLEGEPAIRLTGGIHGSEMISVEVMIRFIEYLTYNYSINSEVAGLINSRYIVIIPVFNPDGLAAKNRNNSNGVDLNRNFSYAWSAGSSHGDYAFSEAESCAMRDFSESNVFHLSATFHSGSVVLNMPFDYGAEHDVVSVVPVENALVRAMALAYTESGTFLENPDVMQSGYSYHGIINGGDWYVITGSLQDWSYKETGCLDMTIEISRRNPNSEAGVQQVFMYNRDSLMAYIKKAGYGVHGQVKDSGGNPVEGVEVTVVYNSGGGITGDLVTKTDSEGYYYRILTEGSYNLVFSKSEYTTYEETAVSVPDDTSSVELNVVLTEATP